MRVPLKWLKEFVDIKASPAKLAEVLTMGGLEVESISNEEGDTVFELNVTPNRSDCLSVKGVARDISALTNKKFHLNTLKAPKGVRSLSDFVSLSVRANDLCPRYSCRVIDHVKVGESPLWLRQRLLLCGIRPVNNIVDATNYVMLETGQPLHAFDLAAVRGRKIIVARANAPFEFATLDGIKRKLAKDDLLICDGEGPVALAGIMGGENSQIMPDTKAVLLESAYFDPVAVRKTSKRLLLSTESSKRFERGVDFMGQLEALHRLTQLILKTAGGSASRDWLDVNSKKLNGAKIKLKISEIERILGIPLPLSFVKSTTKALGFAVSAGTKDALTLLGPSFRPDISAPIDVIEELARVYGYHKIKTLSPRTFVTPTVHTPFCHLKKKAKAALIGLGFSEALTMAFAGGRELKAFDDGRGFIELSNPLASDASFMRTTLITGLLKALETNLARDRHNVRLFSLQRVFIKKGEGVVEEPLNLTGVMTGARSPDNWDGIKTSVDFYDIKGALSAVFTALGLKDDVRWDSEKKVGILDSANFSNVLLGKRPVGFLGRLNDSAIYGLDEPCFVFEINFDAVADFASKKKISFTEPTRFPFIERDIAIIVDETVPSSEIGSIIKADGGALISLVRPFDVYKGQGIPEGKRSIAYTIRYESNERTLTDNDVNEVHGRIVKRLEEKLGASLRT